MSLARRSSAEPAPARRPNIVVIMADDMGFSDLGCYGSEIATPNLDRLAAGGVRLTRFYNTARCCPSRAALLTGLYPHQAGVGHMVQDRGSPAYQGYLNDRCTTIAETLRGAGYHTLMSGKWHVGEDRPHWPVDRGFERSFSLISGGTNYFRLDPGRKMAIDDRPYAPPGDGFYITDAFTDHAADFISEVGRKPEPFFLYLAYTAPHWPLHALPEDIARYRGKYLSGWDTLRERRHRRMIKLGLLDPRWPLTPRDPEAPAWSAIADPKAWDLRMAVYAAQIERMDRGIGKVLDRLREVGAADNTLVMFMVDNGGCAEKIDSGTPGVPPGPKESFLSYGLPWANASNTPFRLYKHWVHEGGIASPMIAHWPGVIPKNEIHHQPGHLIDILPTCLEAAGTKHPAAYRGKPVLPLEGESLLPALRDASQQRDRTLYWEHEGNRAVRQSRGADEWKLVARFRGEWELYDLKADRSEMKNLAAAHPEKVDELKALYEQWARRCGVLPWPPGRPQQGGG